MESPKKLTDLPVEVLDVVFKYLYENDKWRLAMVSPVLGKAFTFHIRDYYEILRIGYSSTLFIRAVVPLCGSSIRRIELDDCFDHYYQLRELIDKYCENLQILVFDIKSNLLAYVKEFLCTSLKARSVDIHIRIANKNIPKIIDVLKQHPKVKVLQLFNIEKGYDRFVKQLVNLETLELTFAPTCPRPNLYDLILPLKSLRHLDIRNIEFDGVISSEELSLCALDSLAIWYCGVAVFPYFSNLKSIRLELSFLDGSFFEWVSSYKNTLEELSFQLSKEEFQINEFFEMLRTCKMLRRIYLNMDLDHLLNLTFVATFVSILKENGISPGSPLKLQTTRKTCDTMIKLLRDIPDSKLVDVYSYQW